MNRFVISLSIIIALALGAPHAIDGARADDDAVGEALKKVDDALFFYDKQDKLAGYDVELVTQQSGVNRGMPSPIVPKPDKAAKRDKLSFDAASGKKTQTDAGGADVMPTSFTPGCGPWTLTTLCGFEVELFARPWTDRFDAEHWDRACDKTDKGWTLKLTPKSPIGEANMLKPAITGFDVEIDKQGVPQRATLHLDQKMMKDDGACVFHFTELKKTKKKRIEKIENTLSSANLKITPALAFHWAEKSEPVMLAAAEFRVAGGELSGTLGGQDFVTFLIFTNAKLKKAK